MEHAVVHSQQYMVVQISRAVCSEEWEIPELRAEPQIRLLGEIRPSTWPE